MAGSRNCCESSSGTSTRIGQCLKVACARLRYRPFERCSAPQKRADNMREMARAPEDDAHQLFPKSVGPHQRVVEINHNRKGRVGHKRFLFVTAL